MDLEPLELAELQERVAEALLEPKPLMESTEMSELGELIATGNDRLSPTEQLDIYREQFWLRHTGAMEEDFASVVAFFGHAPFHALVAEYLLALPPTDYSLRHLGAAFADYVLSAEGIVECDAMVDLIRTEWAFVEAWDAADAPPLDASTIASAKESDWPNARLTLHPSLQLLKLSCAAHEYRAAVRKGEGNEPELRHDETCLVVWRGAEAIQYIDIPKEAFVLLEKLSRGVALGVACEETVTETRTDPTAFEASVGAWFQDWTAYGWVSTVRF